MVVDDQQNQSPEVSSNSEHIRKESQGHESAEIAFSHEYLRIQDLNPIKFSWKLLWIYTGPGWLMSIAFLDPGNIAGDLEAGTAAGYSLLWALLSATIIALYFQILAARLGVVTQRNLARVCREEYSTLVRVILWLMTEIAIIASDIQEVIGSAIALNVLFGIPIWAGTIITICDSLLFLFIHYFGIRKLEFFFALLIITMAICFFMNFAEVDPNMKEVLRGTFVPTIPSGTTAVAIGLVGSIIMPHNLYLHSALVLSRKFDTSDPNQTKESCFYNAIESTLSLTVSFFINFAVVGTFAYYYFNDPTSSINLENAAYYLEDTFGNGVKIIWGVGLLAAGQSSTMTGTYAGQFVMEGFFDIKLPVWKRVMVTRCIAILPALIVALLDEQAIDEVDNILNVVQSIQLPFALTPLVKFTATSLVMGMFANSKLMTVIAAGLGIMLVIMNIVGLFPTDSEWWVYVLVVAGLIIYFGLLFIVVRAPVTQLPPHKPEEEEEQLNDRQVINRNAGNDQHGEGLDNQEGVPIAQTMEPLDLNLSEDLSQSRNKSSFQ